MGTTHLEVDDGGGHQDTKALQQVTHHVDKGCTDAGAARQGSVAGQAASRALQLLVAPVAVDGGGLVQDVGHAAESRAGSVPGREREAPLTLPGVGERAHPGLSRDSTATVQGFRAGVGQGRTGIWEIWDWVTRAGLRGSAAGGGQGMYVGLGVGRGLRE